MRLVALCPADARCRDGGVYVNIDKVLEAVVVRSSIHVAVTAMGTLGQRYTECNGNLRNGEKSAFPRLQIRSCSCYTAFDGFWIAKLAPAWPVVLISTASRFVRAKISESAPRTRS